jgi:hypothetical protein
VGFKGRRRIRPGRGWQSSKNWITKKVTTKTKKKATKLKEEDHQENNEQGGEEGSKVQG